MLLTLFRKFTGPKHGKFILKYFRQIFYPKFSSLKMFVHNVVSLCHSIALSSLLSRVLFANCLAYTQNSVKFGNLAENSMLCARVTQTDFADFSEGQIIDFSFRMFFSQNHKNQ